MNQKKARLTITVCPQSKAQALRIGTIFGQAIAAIVLEFDKLKPGLARCTLERIKSDRAKGKKSITFRGQA